jgi:hypothetical protein
VKRGWLVVIAAVAGCSPDRFEANVYPDGQNLMKDVRAGTFATLEECRAASLRLLAEHGALESGDYECGKNCRDEPDFPGIRVCEETLE